MFHYCTEPDCDAKFTRPYRLKQHLLKHQGKKPFACDEDGCPKSYSNHSHLRRHKQKVHEGVKTNTKRCPVKDCLRLISSDNFRRHLQTVHNLDDKNICSICNRGFQKKHQLRSHMFEHTGVRPFTCEYCPTAFVNITEYKKHKRNHKSYTCSCKEVFYRWSTFLKHRREAEIHKKFLCETCNKNFICKRNYKIHLTTHAANREVFQCPMENCERLYYYKKNLQDHVDIYHLKIKEFPDRKRQYKSKRKEDPTRKDKGSMKQSTALKLAGLTVPYDAEKRLLSGEQIEAENVEEFVDTSDFSDIEISFKIMKDFTTSSEDETRNTESILNEVK